ncbi:MAG: GNAT family N-acetyltransferase [Cyanobacteria bacterium J06600_6]
MKQYRDFLVREWQPADREAAAGVIKTVLEEYGLPWQPELADRDVIEIEEAYLKVGGEFWVIEQDGIIVATAAYQPIERGQNAVEIRKMYLLPSIRGLGLGRYLLQELENAIAIKDYQEIWIETASILKEAVRLYERNGYEPAEGVETARCDRVYLKRLHS